MDIEEVVVVEGKADTQQLKKAVNAETYETNGSAVSEETLTALSLLAGKRGIIVFTDPDFNGERIRKIIAQKIPNAKHAFIERKDGVPLNAGGSLGVEHASIEAIRKALASVYTPAADHHGTISRSLMLNLGLLGNDSARVKREQLGRRLGIGYTNGKQMLCRLNLFQITAQQLIDAVAKIDQENGEPK